MSASAVQPSDANAVAFLQVGDPGAESCDDARSLMARDEWWSGLDGPVTVCRMQICVADSGGKHFYKCLPWFRRWNGDFPND